MNAVQIVLTGLSLSSGSGADPLLSPSQMLLTGVGIILAGTGYVLWGYRHHEARRAVVRVVCTAGCLLILLMGVSFLARLVSHMKTEYGVNVLSP